MAMGFNTGGSGSAKKKSTTTKKTTGKTLAQKAAEQRDIQKRKQEAKKAQAQRQAAAAAAKKKQQQIAAAKAANERGKKQTAYVKQQQQKAAQQAAAKKAAQQKSIAQANARGKAQTAYVKQQQQKAAQKAKEKAAEKAGYEALKSQREKIRETEEYSKMRTTDVMRAQYEERERKKRAEVEERGKKLRQAAALRNALGKTSNNDSGYRGTGSASITSSKPKLYGATDSAYRSTGGVDSNYSKYVNAQINKEKEQRQKNLENLSKHLKMQQESGWGQNSVNNPTYNNKNFGKTGGASGMMKSVANTPITTTTGNYSQQNQTKEGKFQTAKKAEQDYQKAIKSLDNNAGLKAASDAIRTLSNGGRAFNQGLVNSLLGGAKTGGAAARGLGKLLGNDTLTNIGNGILTQGDAATAEMAAQEEKENPFSATKVGQAFQSAGQNSLTGLASLLFPGLGQAGTLALMGTNVFGNDYANALNRLGNGNVTSLTPQEELRALLYAAADTGKEVGSELVSLNDLMPGGIPDSISDVLGEGWEEVTGGLFEPYINELINTDESGNLTNENLADILQAGFNNKFSSPEAFQQYLADQIENFVGGIAQPAVQGGAMYAVNPTFTNEAGQSTTYREQINGDIQNSLNAISDYRQYQRERTINNAQNGFTTLKSGDKIQNTVQQEFGRKYATYEALHSQNQAVKHNALIANRDSILNQAEQLKIDKNDANNIAKIANKGGFHVEMQDANTDFEGKFKGKQAYVDESGIIHLKVGEGVDSVNQLFAHEVAHEAEGSKQWDRMKHTLEKMKDKGQLKGTLDYDQLSDNEKVATLLAEAVGNPDSLKTVASRNQTTARYILNRLQSLGQGTTVGIGKAERALNNALKNTQAQIENRAAEAYTNKKAATLVNGDEIRLKSAAVEKGFAKTATWTVDSVTTADDGNVTVKMHGTDKNGNTVTIERKAADIERLTGHAFEEHDGIKSKAEEDAFNKFTDIDNEDYESIREWLEDNEIQDENGRKFEDEQIWDAYKNVVSGKEPKTSLEHGISDWIDDQFDFKDNYDVKRFANDNISDEIKDESKANNNEIKPDEPEIKEEKVPSPASETKTEESESPDAGEDVEEPSEVTEPVSESEEAIEEIPIEDTVDESIDEDSTDYDFSNYNIDNYDDPSFEDIDELNQEYQDVVPDWSSMTDDEKYDAAQEFYDGLSDYQESSQSSSAEEETSSDRSIQQEYGTASETGSINNVENTLNETAQSNTATSEANQTQNFSASDENIVGNPTIEDAGSNYEVGPSETTTSNGLTGEGIEVNENTPEVLGGTAQATAETSQAVTATGDYETDLQNSIDIGSQKLSKAAESNDLDSSVQAMQGIAKDMLNSSSDETKQKAQQAIEDGLKKMGSDMPDAAKEKLAHETAEELRQGIEDINANEEAEVKKAANQTAVNKSRGKDTNSKQTKRQLKTKIEDEDSSVYHTVFDKKQATLSSTEKYNKYEQGTYDFLTSYEPKMISRGITPSSHKKFNSFKDEFAQVYHDIRYFESQYETTVDDIVKKFNKKGGEYFKNGQKLKFSYETNQYSLRGKENALVTDLSEAMQNDLKHLNDTVLKRDTLLSKEMGWNGIAGTVLNLTRPETMILDEMSPSARKRAIQFSLDRINKYVENHYSSKYRGGAKMILTETESDLVDEAAYENNYAERQKILAKLEKSIADRMPTSLLERADAFRYLNLLSAPITWVRNTIGNVGSAASFRMADGVGSFVEANLDKRGRIRHNSLDFTNDADMQMVSGSSKVLENTLEQLGTNATASGHIAKYLKSMDKNSYKEFSKLVSSKGFEKYGNPFNVNDSNKYYFQIANEQFASHLKDSGYTVKDGKIYSPKGNHVGKDSTFLQKLALQSYHEAVYQFASSDQMINRNMSTNRNSSAQDRKPWRNYLNAVNDKRIETSKTDFNNTIGESDIYSGVMNEHAANALGKKGPLRAAANVQNYVMNKSQYIGDAGFTGRRYAINMARYMDSQGYTTDGTYSDGYTPKLVKGGKTLSLDNARKVISKYHEMAMQDALESTFHDVDAVVQKINALKTGDTFGEKVTGQLLGAVVPFVSTPWNIAKRIVEFSPAGLADTIVRGRYEVQHGTITAQTYVRRLAQGMTGSALTAVGILMGSIGILRGKGDDDDDEYESRFKESNGNQEYALVLPNGDTVTLEWMAPSTTPLLLGAHIYETVKKMSAGGMSPDDILNTSLGLLDPLSDASYISGLVDIAESAFGKNSDNGEAGFNSLIKSVLKNFARQWTPNEGGKLLQTFDGVKRSTYADNYFEGMFRSAAQNMFVTNMVYKAVTGDYINQPQIDTSGNDIKVDDYGMDGFGRFLNTHFNPASIKHNTYQSSKENPNNKYADDVNAELLRLYKATGKQYSYILPSVSSKIGDHKLTAEERTIYNKEYLQSYKKEIAEFINSPTYNNYTDKEKADIINSIQSMYYYKTQDTYYKANGLNANALNDKNKAAVQLEKMGIAPYRFFEYQKIKAVTDDDGDNITNSKQLLVREQMEANGDYEKLEKAYRSGHIRDLSTVNMNPYVMAMTETEYNYKKDLLDDGLLESSKNQDKIVTLADFLRVSKKNKELEETAQKYGINPRQIYANRDIKAAYYPDGDAIQNSGRQEARYQAMTNGTWQTLTDAVAKGEISEDDACSILGVNKTVFEQEDDKFITAYNKLQLKKYLIDKGEYNPEDFQNGGRYYKYGNFGSFVDPYSQKEDQPISSKEKSIKSTLLEGDTRGSRATYDQLVRNVDTSSNAANNSQADSRGVAVSKGNQNSNNSSDTESLYANLASGTYKSSKKSSSSKSKSSKKSGSSSTKLTDEEKLAHKVFGWDSTTKTYKDRDRLLEVAGRYGIDENTLLLSHNNTKEVGADGYEISNSDYAKSRISAEASGKWDEVHQAVKNGDITLKDACTILGVNKTVFNMSKVKFGKLVKKIEDESGVEIGPNDEVADDVDYEAIESKLFKTDDERERVYDLAQRYGINSDDVLRAHSYETETGEDGYSISNSGYAKARVAAESSGAFDKVKEAYKNGDITLKDACTILGVNKTVFNMNKVKFGQLVKKIEDSTGNEIGPNDAYADDVDYDALDKKIFKNSEGKTRLMGLASKLGITEENVYSYHTTETDEDSDGFSITNSGYAKARELAEENGTWEKMQKAVANGQIKLKDACTIMGVNKTIFNMSDEKFETLKSNIEKKIDGTYDASASKKKSSSSKRSSGSSSSYSSSGGSSSYGSSSSNISNTSYSKAWSTVFGGSKKSGRLSLYNI